MITAHGFYDPVVARWGVIDGKAELYFQITPYAYAANTPINAIDPNGRLVIFVNGNYTDGTGGTRQYWQKKRMLRRILQPALRDRLGSNLKQVLFTQDFAGAVMDKLGDHHSKYIDGGGNVFKGYHPIIDLLAPGLAGVGAADRQGAGYNEGSEEAAAVIESLHRTNGVIDESIKVIAHSMGAAYW